MAHYPTAIPPHCVQCRVRFLTAQLIAVENTHQVPGENYESDKTSTTYYLSLYDYEYEC